jgi:ribonuclease VapC
MHWINLGEVYYQSIRRVGLERGARALDKALSMHLRLHLPDTHDIKSAAELKARYRISYADAFAVALAQRLDASVATGDPEIIALRNIVRVLALTRDVIKK